MYKFNHCFPEVKQFSETIGYINASTMFAHFLEFSSISSSNFFFWSQCHLYTWHSLSPNFCDTFLIYSLDQFYTFLYSFSSSFSCSLFFLYLFLISLLTPPSSFDFLRREDTHWFKSSKESERFRDSSSSELTELSEFEDFEREGWFERDKESWTEEEEGDAYISWRWGVY